MDETEPAKMECRVSFAVEAVESKRSDSTQENKPHAEVPRRRPSLTAAVRRASALVGDGLCESRKELRLLGILPEPESEEDNGSISPGSVSPGSNVNPTHTSDKGGLRTIAEEAENRLDFDAEGKEEESIKESFRAFSFDTAVSPRNCTKACGPNDEYEIRGRTRTRNGIRSFSESSPTTTMLRETARETILPFRPRSETRRQSSRQLMQLPLSDHPNKYVLISREMLESQRHFWPMYQWWTTEPVAEENCGASESPFQPVNRSVLFYYN